MVVLEYNTQDNSHSQKIQKLIQTEIILGRMKIPITGELDHRTTENLYVFSDEVS